MPRIVLSKEVHARVVAFKQVVEAVIGEEMDLGEYVEFILAKGIDSVLTDLLGAQDSGILLMSLQQLGSRYPTQVYEYVAETVMGGAVTQEQESMSRQLGFQPRTAGGDEGR